MLSMILNLLPIISIVLSLYLLHLIKKRQDSNSLIEDNQVLIEKYIIKNQKNITKLEKELSEDRENISSLKFTITSDFRTIESKTDDLLERWDIVADDRITSIPQNNKEWWEAKQIIAQAPQKIWKAKNLSQTKSGFINENAKCNNVEQDEDEINQDFSALSDEDFDNILDDDSDDTDSSGATDNLQQQKPKRKKSLQKTM